MRITFLIQAAINFVIITVGVVYGKNTRLYIHLYRRVFF